MYKMIVFDLDGTLAESKSPITPNMAFLLKELLRHKQVCIITGGTTEQIFEQVIRTMGVITHIKPEELTNLHLMPTCGTKYICHNNLDWEYKYEHNIDEMSRKKIISVVEDSARKLLLWEENTYGDIIEDRGSQITFSALGQRAPIDLKLQWDPTNNKKFALRDYIAQRLPEFEVRAGGSTSIDITMNGIDKAYGVRQLCDLNNLDYTDVLFIGDRLEVGGNDRPVVELGIDSIAVKSPLETEQIINNLIHFNSVRKYN